MPEPRRSGRRPLSRRTVLTAGAAGLGTTLTGTLTSCSGADATASGKVTLTFGWWGNDDRAARTEEAVRLFEKEHPGVTVRTSNAEFGSYLRKLATQAAGGDIPDVTQLDYRQISQYSGSGALLDLGDAVEQGTIRTSRMDRQLVRTGSYEGRQYALPMGRGITGFAYDSHMYEKAGVDPPTPSWTWDDWEDAARRVAALRLTSPDGRHVTGANNGGDNEDIFEAWLISRGGRLYANRTKLGYTEDELTEFWTFLDRLRKRGVVATAEDTAQARSTETSPMGRKLAAADFTWDAPFPAYTELLGDAVHFAPVPTTKGRTGAYFKPSMLLAVGAHTQHPEQAARLVDFLLNDHRAGDILGFTRSTPPNREVAARVATTLKGAEREIYEYAQRMEKYGLAEPPAAPPRGDEAIRVAFRRHYQRIMFELATPRQAARELIDEANRELTS